MAWETREKVELSNSYALRWLCNASWGNEARVWRVKTLGEVQPRQKWTDSDGGERLVCHVSGGTIIFLSGNRFYAQAGEGFADDVASVHFEEAGRRLAPGAKIAEGLAHAIIGFAAASSGAAAVGLVGLQVGTFLYGNRDNIPHWKRAVEVSLKARDVLKRYAPTLYNKVVRYIVIRVLKDSVPNLPEGAVSDPKILCRLVGVLFAKGAQYMLESRISAGKLIFGVCAAVLLRLGQSYVAAVKITIDQYRQQAKQLIESARLMGVALTERDVEAILQELAKNKEHIKPIIEELDKAFAQVKVVTIHD